MRAFLKTHRIRGFEVITIDHERWPRILSPKYHYPRLMESDQHPSETLPQPPEPTDSEGFRYPLECWGLASVLPEYPFSGAKIQEVVDDIIQANTAFLLSPSKREYMTSMLRELVSLIGSCWLFAPYFVHGERSPGDVLYGSLAIVKVLFPLAITRVAKLKTQSLTDLDYWHFMYLIFMAGREDLSQLPQEEEDVISELVRSLLREPSVQGTRRQYLPPIPNDTAKQLALAFLRLTADRKQRKSGLQVLQGFAGHLLSRQHKKPDAGQSTSFMLPDFSMVASDEVEFEMEVNRKKRPFGRRYKDSSGNYKVSEEQNKRNIAIGIRRKLRPRKKRKPPDPQEIDYSKISDGDICDDVELGSEEELGGFLEYAPEHDEQGLHHI